MARLFFLLPLTLLPLLQVAAQATSPTAPPPVAWADHTRLLPEALRGLPTGLTLSHSPTPVYPAPDAGRPGGFRWHHATTVRAEAADLEVIACGSYIWYSAAGWQANIRQTPAEFATAFACPSGKLRRGRAYTFAQNDRTTDSAAGLYPGDALWFVLARDPRTGVIYKGLGLVETESDVRPSR